MTAEEAIQEPVIEEAPAVDYGPRRSVVFIGSECYPFVKSGGLGDVMYALPKELARQNCDVKVILPRYACIPWEYQEKMVYRGSFDMDLCSDGRRFYVGIMEYVWDGVVYDFIDNQEFFTNGNPYTNLVDDIPKFCYFGKAALAALLYMDWIPDVIHCHDWQAGLVPLYLRTMFENTKLASAKTVFTIHNLRFQGIYNIETIQYWSGLPDYVFNKDCLTQNWLDANMLKGGLAYSNMITTVSHTYAGEIQTPFFGEGLDDHLRYHSGKLRGIVNGIDVETWDPATDWRVPVNYSTADAIAKKKENKAILQEEVGLEKDDGKFVIGLISRLTNQKGLDLINAIIPALMDGNTQIAVLGTGDPQYEDSFRYYENAYKGSVSSSIMYDETRAHRIYAGADALLVPSLFEPCGLTQLNAMRYGTVPIVRETGGLKDTVEPYNQFENTGNGFTFDRYETGLLLDACNRAKTLFFTERDRWDEMIIRDMQKDVSWAKAAKQYKDMYLELTQR
ncbi:MAG: glycogen/starch synthase [Lachnospiraceae bacterium]|nr:glycogen/starch synthase [Lachnospiraceae bacterium]